MSASVPLQTEPILQFPMNYEELLRQHDDTVNWEWPPNFDFEAAERDFYALVAALEEQLGIKLEAVSGVHVQDASFRGQVEIRQHAETALLRCSNFGQMASIANEDALPPSIVSTVKSVLVGHGYVFVPESELARTYTGTNPGVTGIATWWARYFDWI